MGLIAACEGVDANAFTNLSTRSCSTVLQSPKAELASTRAGEPTRSSSRWAIRKQLGRSHPRWGSWSSGVSWNLRMRRCLWRLTARRSMCAWHEVSRDPDREGLDHWG